MKTMVRLSIAAVLIGLAAPALAATTTGTFQVTATVQPSCQVATTNTLAFGNYVASAATPGSTTFTVECTMGHTYTVGLDDGSFAGLAAPSTRAMEGDTTTTEYLGYDLYQDNLFTTLWTNAATVAGGGAGVTLDTFTVFGRIPAGQYGASAQGYTDDAVTITVTY